MATLAALNDVSHQTGLATQSADPESDAWKQRMRAIRLRLLRPDNLQEQDRIKLMAELITIEMLTRKLGLARNV